MSHHYVDAQDLCYDYPDGTPALRGVSFRLEHGESVALVGGNGAGKSTLLMLLTAAILPKSGLLNIGDLVLNKKNARRVQAQVGLVFQDPDDQLFMPTVYDDVAFGPLNLGLPPDEARKRAESALAAVGCLEIQDRPPYRLSGGQKRAVAIASILAMEPHILVLDEPSSNLDHWARRQLIGLLKSFTHTKIIATHDLALAAEVCSRVIVLSQGRVLADGPAAEILPDEPLMAPARQEALTPPPQAEQNV